MADRSLLHPLLLQPHNNAVLEDLERQQRDALASTIARRMAATSVGLGGRTKRHTATHIRSLAWPVYVQGRKCLAAVTIHYVLSHPRQHIQESFWYANIAEARGAHPKGKLLPDPDRVLGHLQA
jgi:hypothetical protein